MKRAILGAAAVMAGLHVVPVDANAQGYGYGYERRAHAERVRAEQRHRIPFYGRPASVQANGLCQRDTGTPTGSLNFRNRCDVEEFWNRTFRGGGRR